MTVTFCGHSDIFYDENIKRVLYNKLEELITFGAKKFLLGGYGNFDILAAEAVNKLKEKYPYIESILVIPYLNRDYSTKLYDCTLYPPIETIPKKLAIIKRNAWMIENCDILVAYVRREYGGAAKTLSFAEKNGKIIFRL